MELTPISEKEFRKVPKGCGIKYRNKIPSQELKAKLGYCPLSKNRKVEISDETGFCKVYNSLKKAVEDCGISNSSTIKYALDNDKPSIKRRLGKKIFFVREI